MTYTRISRTLAATGVTAALLCALPAVGQADAAGGCDPRRDGHDYIDWARACSSHNHPALPHRRIQPLRTLLDGRPEYHGTCTGAAPAQRRWSASSSRPMAAA
jgi:hypothetical protein